jgi:putative transposase
VVRAGCGWCLSLKESGPSETITGYFRAWIRHATWRILRDTLRDCVRRTEGRNIASTAVIIASQSVKVSDQAGLRGYSAGKRISGRKGHLAVDTLGMILAIPIASAAVRDRDAGKDLIQLMFSMYHRIQIIWADGGYLGKLMAWLKQLRVCGKLKLEIVHRSDEVKGFEVLPKRWIVERTFGWLVKSRRLVREYEVRTVES